MPKCKVTEKRKYPVVLNGPVDGEVNGQRRKDIIAIIIIN